MIHVKLVMGNLTLSCIFHVIDAKTFDKLLVRRPWLYERGIIAYALYECMKYYWGRERKINDSVKLFTKVDPHFIDARFFEEDDTPKKTMPSIITSTGRGSAKIVI